MNLSPPGVLRYVLCLLTSGGLEGGKVKINPWPKAVMKIRPAA